MPRHSRWRPSEPTCPSLRGHLRCVPGTVPAHHDDHHGRADGPLPIALGFGAGAEARGPLGLAVAGGLVVSQLLTEALSPYQRISIV